MSCRNCTAASCGTARQKQSAISTGASPTSRSTSRGSSWSMMQSDARKSALISSNATRLRVIASRIAGCHSWVARISVSSHRRSRSYRTSGLSSTRNRWAQTASAWL